jgi:hypothetical protein
VLVASTASYLDLSHKFRAEFRGIRNALPCYLGGIFNSTEYLNSLVASVRAGEVDGMRFGTPGVQSSTYAWRAVEYVPRGAGLS